MATTGSRSRWLRRLAGSTGALLAAVLVLPVPVLAATGLTFNNSWSVGTYESGPAGHLPPTPTYSETITSNGANGQQDVVDIGMGSYTGVPAASQTQEAFETITLNRSITWNPTGSEKGVDVSWNLDEFLNSAAQGIDQAVVLNSKGVVVANLLNPQTYAGSGSTPTEKKLSATGMLTKAQLAAGNYTLQVTVRFQTLVNNKIGGQWQSKSASHVFDFYAQ